MRAAAILCECNPPHAGHEYLIQSAKRASDCVICLLSGPFVQRGEAAILSPHARAEILADMGADLVLELPFPYAAASAEIFAAAGVSIFSRLGADSLWFGSESGDLQFLQTCASVAQSPAFRAAYAERAGKEKTGTATLYFDLLAEFCGMKEPPKPNDILAIAYLCAIAAQNSPLVPQAVLRVGAEDGDLSLLPDVIPSAAALRKTIFEGKTHTIPSYFSEFEQKILQRESEAGRFPASLNHASAAVLLHLRRQEDFEEIAEASGGIGNRLHAAANGAADLEELLAKAATKKYPNARLRRAMLFSVLGVQTGDLFALPAYVRMLAANATGRAFLSGVRKTAQIPVATAHSGIPKTPQAQRQEELSRHAAELYALCTPKPESPANLLRQGPIIL